MEPLHQIIHLVIGELLLLLCAQQGPLSGIGSGAFLYLYQPAMANTYCDFYVASNGANINCANFLWYTTGDVGPVTNSLNTWGTALAPNGTNYVKFVTSKPNGGWNGSSYLFTIDIQLLEPLFFLPDQHNCVLEQQVRFIQLVPLCNYIV